jgi:hypothetical protein
MHLFVWKEKLLLISGRKESLNSQRLGALTVSPFSSALSIFPVTARLGILLCDYWSTSIPPALSAPRPITAVSPAQKCRPTYAQPSVPIYRGLQGNSHLLASFPSVSFLASCSFSLPLSFQSFDTCLTPGLHHGRRNQTPNSDLPHLTRIDLLCLMR